MSILKGVSSNLVKSRRAEELVGAALWYEERQPGLGDDFLDEVEHALRRIEAEPERWPKIRSENRKLNLRLFPYALVYVLGR